MSDQAVVIWGEVLWDLFPDGPQLGGAPANVAWHLGQAGGWARLVTRVGDDDDGRRAIAQLEQVVDVSLVQIDGERATGTVEVSVNAGEPSYRLVPGRAWERIACTADVRAALAEASVLVYGTLSQRTPEGLAAWRDAVRAAAATCIKVYDLNLRKAATTEIEERASVDAGIAAADVIKVNDRELAALAEWRGWSDPVRALRDNRPSSGTSQGRPSSGTSQGRRVLAVTHGAAGSTLYSDAGAVEIPGVRAPAPVDNVGCGDAYLAILVHGLTRGWDLRECGLAASRWASAVASARGATPTFSDDRVAELLGDADD
jgi:fructokinase